MAGLFGGGGGGGSKAVPGTPLSLRRDERFQFKPYRGWSGPRPTKTDVVVVPRPKPVGSSSSGANTIVAAPIQETSSYERLRSDAGVPKPKPNPKKPPYYVTFDEPQDYEGAYYSGEPEWPKKKEYKSSLRRGS